jgi:hypothetical protein
VFVPRSVEPALTIYIVADEAQAQKVLRGEDDAAQMRAASGDFAQAGDVDVLVANDQALFERTLGDIATANDIRAQTGLPPMPVVDLR